MNPSKPVHRPIKAELFGKWWRKKMYTWYLRPKSFSTNDHIDSVWSASTWDIVIISVVPNVFVFTASTEATSEVPPSFVWSSTESVTVVQGENLTLECAAHGVPAPQLSWEKYGGHVPYGRHSLLLGKISDVHYYINIQLYSPNIMVAHK